MNNLGCSVCIRLWFFSGTSCIHNHSIFCNFRQKLSTHSMDLWRWVSQQEFLSFLPITPVLSGTLCVPYVYLMCTCSSHSSVQTFKPIIQFEWYDWRQSNFSTFKFCVKNKLTWQPYKGIWDHLFVKFCYFYDIKWKNVWNLGV